jgi:hypothetical protein
MQGLEDIETQEQLAPAQEEPTAPEPTEEEPAEASPETVTLPAAIGGTPLQAGQTVTLQIVSVDETGAQATMVSEGAADDGYEDAGSEIDRMAEG